MKIPVLKVDYELLSMKIPDTPYNNTTTEVGCLQELDEFTTHIFS